MRAWHEKELVCRYCLASAAASAFQFTFRLLTATVASWTENPSPAEESSWLISPCLENDDVCRYCFALSTACCSEGVRFDAEPVDGAAVVAVVTARATDVPEGVAGLIAPAFVLAPVGVAGEPTPHPTIPADAATMLTAMSERRNSMDAPCNRSMTSARTHTRAGHRCARHAVPAP